MKERHLFRTIIMLCCMLIMTTAAFADNVNTDVDEGDDDGQYTFTSENEKYGYESYLNSDLDSFVGARLYNVTIPDEGKLMLEVSSSEITHMTMMVYCYEREKRVYEQDLVAEDGVKGTGETVALPAGKYHVTFMYTFMPDSTLRYDEPGKKYFKHYISWKKASFIRTSGVTVTPASMTLEEGGYDYVKAAIAPSDAYFQEVTWTSSAPGIAEVNEYGEITAKAAGTAVITAATKDGSKGTCTVTVTEPKKEDSGNTDYTQTDTDQVYAGEVAAVSAGTVKVLSPSSRTVAFTKAKNVKKVTVPASVSINGKTFKVTQINANAFKGKKIRTVTIGKNVKVIKKNAFKGSKATKIILKTKLLKKAKVKGCLKGSKVKTIQVKVGSKSLNKKYVKNYKKIFTKANAGKKVTVK